MTSREALKSALEWVHHWQKDRACGLLPSPQSLAQAEAEIKAALANEKEAEDA